MRSIRTRAAALLTALAIALGADLVSPTPAVACGGYGDFTPDALVRSVVNAHYQRRGRGDGEMLAAGWLPQAQVVSIRKGPKGPAITSRPIAEAARVWASADQAASWTVGAIDVDGDMATATIRSTRRGVTRDETVILTLVDGAWWLAGMVSLDASA